MSRRPTEDRRLARRPGVLEDQLVGLPLAREDPGQPGRDLARPLERSRLDQQPELATQRRSVVRIFDQRPLVKPGGLGLSQPLGDPARRHRRPADGPGSVLQGGELLDVEGPLGLQLGRLVPAGRLAHEGGGGIGDLLQRP
jgi:hypothetical protein